MVRLKRGKPENYIWQRLEEETRRMGYGDCSRINSSYTGLCAVNQSEPENEPVQWRPAYQITVHYLRFSCAAGANHFMELNVCTG